jgi:hypothetical protein
MTWRLVRTSAGSLPSTSAMRRPYAFVHATLAVSSRSRMDVRFLWFSFIVARMSSWSDSMRTRFSSWYGTTESCKVSSTLPAKPDMHSSRAMENCSVAISRFCFAVRKLTKLGASLVAVPSPSTRFFQYDACPLLSSSAEDASGSCTPSVTDSGCMKNTELT